MAAITYTAIDRGELRSGHSALTQYSFDIPFTAFTRSLNRQQSTLKSISGKRVTTFENLETGFSVSTVMTEDTVTRDNMLEFLTSVVAGEEFSIDPDGSVASPDSPFTVVLTGTPSETREDIAYSYSFEIVKV